MLYWLFVASALYHCVPGLQIAIWYGLGVCWVIDARLESLRCWLDACFDAPYELEALANDASFRRYFRCKINEMTYVVMDAPPPREDVRPFVAIAKAFHQCGLCVPVVHQMDEAQGYLLLSDLGDCLYQAQLNEGSVDLLYGKAFEALYTMQSCQPQHFGSWELPRFDQTLLDAEWHLLTHWYLERYIGYALTQEEQAQLSEVYALLVANVKAQPQVCVHRDFHSRNLLLTADDAVGILDFQDAVWGPMAYDVVSLLRDAYVAWPEQRVRAWIQTYWQNMPNQPAGVSEAQWLQWVDWTGVQRHLKVLGIFARLYQRDGKSRYLQDMPRVHAYLLQVTDRYPELHSLHQLLQRAA